MGSPDSALPAFALELWLAVWVSSAVAVNVLAIRPDSMPRVGWIFHFFARGSRRWGPPDPVARPLRRGDAVDRYFGLIVLAIIQVQPILWIVRAVDDDARAWLIGIAAVFYLLELLWWLRLWRLPRLIIYSPLPQNEEERSRVIAADVAQFDADYRARVSEQDRPG
jgi:hypothetical protein